VINKIEYSARNLTPDAGLFLLLEHAIKNGVFDLINHNLVLEGMSTNKIKMDHFKTVLYGNFIVIDKIIRLKLLLGDSLINEFNISIKEPETISRFLGIFYYKTTQILREIKFKIFRIDQRKKKHKSIVIDIDSSLVNGEGHQRGSVRMYDPKKAGNNCYGLQFASCDEIKVSLVRYVRSGHTYTANGKSEMIKEILCPTQRRGIGNHLSYGPRQF
jgi:hypothetical protein